MIKLNPDISLKLILISIFLIPLTISDQRLLINLGEFRNETYIFPLLIVVLLVFFRIAFVGKAKIPTKSPYFALVMLLVVWCFFTFVFSFYDIFKSDFKGVYGISRFLKQFLSLIFSVIVTPLVIYNVFIDYNQENLFQKIEKVIVSSLVIVFVFGVFEIFSDLYNSQAAHGIISWINNNLPVIYIKEDLYDKRVSSISHEPPFLGMYLIFITPWIIRGSVINKKKWKYFLLLTMIVILILASKSRAAQLFCFFEIFVFYTFLILTKKLIFLKFIKGLALIVMISPFIFLWKGNTIIKSVEERIDSFKIIKNLETNNSNKTRGGTIIAGLITFSENPITGVGYGQQGYYLIDRYPDWAVNGNWEIERYLKEEEKNFPPGFNIYVRLLAETGLIGFLLFILFISLILYATLKKYFITKDLNYLFFFVSFIGFSLNWVQIDTPRIYGFWIIFVLFIIYNKQRKHERERSDSTNPPLQ